MKYKVDIKMKYTIFHYFVLPNSDYAILVLTNHNSKNIIIFARKESRNQSRTCRRIRQFMPPIQTPYIFSTWLLCLCQCAHPFRLHFKVHFVDLLNKKVRRPQWSRITASIARVLVSNQSDGTRMCKIRHIVWWCVLSIEWNIAVKD